MFVSFANRTKFNFCEEFGVSLINIRNRRGPSTQPCGTPHGTISLTGINESISVVWVRLNRYDENQSLTMPRTPEWFNLLSKIEWSTASKAFFKSMKIPHDNSLLSMFFCKELTISIIACWVECLSRKPYCDLERISFLSINAFNRLNIIFSKIRL